MVTERRNVIGMAICVSVAVICMAWWWYRKPDPLSYLKPSLVTDLSVTLADGSPLPSEIGMNDKFVVLIRFRPTDQMQVLQDAAYFYVRNEGQYHSDKIDFIEVFRQFPTGEGPPVSFIDQVKGITVNVAPPPPARDVPYQQWCAWFNAGSFEHHRQPGLPLEIDLWLFPKRDATTTIPPVGNWFFRHKFRLSK